MPFDAVDSDIEICWSAFGQYVCDPYALNEERHPEVQAWFHDLYARKETETLQLSRKHIRSRQLFGKPYSFDAFCLNEQMYFSRDSAVLLLPFCPRNGDEKAEKNIGIWLHDFGMPDAQARNAYRQFGTYRFKEGNLSPYVGNIISKITEEFGKKGLPARKTNILDESYWEMDVCETPDVTGERHADFDGYYGEHRDERCRYAMWGRKIVHSLWSKGTLYYVGAAESEISCPPGATASHLTNGFYIGADHRAQACPGGRAVLMGITYDARALKTRPWEIMP